MRSYAKTNDVKKEMMHIFTYLVTSDVAFDLPVGSPDYVEFNNLPENGRKLEILLRKIGYFLTGNDQKIQNPMKREKVFVGWLESLATNEAKTLIAIKDRDFKFLGVDFHLLQAAYPGWCPLTYVAPVKPQKQVTILDAATIKARQEAEFAAAQDDLDAINAASVVVSAEETDLEVPGMDPKDYPVSEPVRPTLKRGGFKKKSKSGGKTTDVDA